jgi:hypothetical protein
MFKWLRKIFMTSDNIEKNEVSNAEVVNDTNNVDSTKLNNISTKKRFEIEIYDKISVGDPPYDRTQLQKVFYEKPVIIEASSKKELDDFGAQLALCNQIFKIVRVLDDVPQAKPIQNIAPQQTQQNNIQNNTKQHTEQTVEQHIEKRKPKFFKIGNIEIKDDNGKIYQKQWLKLTDEEMSNFRIVNNKNNAVVNLKDKSIEMKRWVLVESSEDTTSSLEKEISYE